MTIEQEVKEAVHYIADVFKKQRMVIDCQSLYGDGSRWKNMKRSGFETVYNVVLDKFKKESSQ